MSIYLGVMLVLWVTQTATEQLGALATGLPLLVAFLVALGYLLKRLRLAFRWLENIERITTKELEPNTGESMKDDMVGVAQSLGLLQRQVDELEDEFRRHLLNSDGRNRR
jgi:hypothetical protein